MSVHAVIYHRPGNKNDGAMVDMHFGFFLFVFFSNGLNLQCCYVQYKKRCSVCKCVVTMHIFITRQLGFFSTSIITA